MTKDFKSFGNTEPFKALLKKDKLSKSVLRFLAHTKRPWINWLLHDIVDFNSYVQERLLLMLSVLESWYKSIFPQVLHVKEVSLQETTVVWTLCL